MGNKTVSVQQDLCTYKMHFIIIINAFYIVTRLYFFS